LISFAQKLPSGTYIFKYCDYEYNKCLSTCTVVITGNKIKLYSLEGLSVQKGRLLESGTIMKHKSGKWIIGKNKKDIYKSKGNFENGFPEIDFKRKRVWQF
jgi:hypothetical protein